MQTDSGRAAFEVVVRIVAKRNRLCYFQRHAQIDEFHDSLLELQVFPACWREQATSRLPFDTTAVNDHHRASIIINISLSLLIEIAGCLVIGCMLAQQLNCFPASGLSQC
jgi:hypothetical protein